MGKRNCRELRDVKVDFVSFVPRGANGEEFAIFKSAEYKPPGEGEEVRLEDLQRGVEPAQQTTVELSREETGVLRRVFGFLFGKRGDEEEGAMSTELKKAIEALTAEVTRMSAIVEKALKPVSKGDDDKGDGDGKGKDGEAPEAPAEGGDAADGTAADGGTGAADGGDAGDGAASGDGDGKAGPEVAKDAEAISALRDTVVELNSKIEQLSKGRLPEAGVEREGEMQAVAKDGKRQRPSFKNWIG